jgi:hypothetical protein
MPTITTLTADARSRLVETTARFFTDAELLQWFIFAETDIASKTECLEKIASLSTVAYQQDYAFPTDYMDIEAILYENDTKLQDVDLRSWQYKITGSPDSTGDPEVYLPFRNKFRIYPPKADNATTTTLNGAISDSATTITVLDTTGFCGWGRIIIDSEVISYTHITATTFLGCVRGDEGTTAAAHLTAATVTERDLQVYYYNQPATMTAGGDTPSIPAQYHELLVLYAVAIALKKDNKWQEGNNYYQEYTRGLNLMIDEITSKYRDKLSCIKDEEQFNESQNGII